MVERGLRSAARAVGDFYAFQRETNRLPTFGTLSYDSGTPGVLSGKRDLAHKAAGWWWVIRPLL